MKYIVWTNGFTITGGTDEENRAIVKQRLQEMIDNDTIGFELEDDTE